MPQLTNCINCGAVLHGQHCEYCDTDYSNIVDHITKLETTKDSITIAFDDDAMYGTLTFKGHVFKVYLAEMSAESFCNDYIYSDGCKYLTMADSYMKHKFTLIEV